MNETLIGQLSGNEVVRRVQFDNPYTYLNQIAEQTRILREYNEKKNTVLPSTEAAIVQLSSKRMGTNEVEKSEKNFVGQKINSDKPSILFYNSTGSIFKGRSSKSNIEYYA
ncbi:MAG: hypothetical protein K8R21_12460 [Leptospira sp.]|nr:hypothetical protein [Leptospira sp.]